MDDGGTPQASNRQRITSSVKKSLSKKGRRKPVPMLMPPKHANYKVLETGGPDDKTTTVVSRALLSTSGQATAIWSAKTVRAFMLLFLPCMYTCASTKSYVIARTGVVSFRRDSCPALISSYPSMAFVLSYPQAKLPDFLVRVRFLACLRSAHSQPSWRIIFPKVRMCQALGRDMGDGGSSSNCVSVVHCTVGASGGIACESRLNLNNAAMLNPPHKPKLSHNKYGPCKPHLATAILLWRSRCSAQELGHGGNRRWYSETC